MLDGSQCYEDEISKYYEEYDIADTAFDMKCAYMRQQLKECYDEEDMSIIEENGDGYKTRTIKAANMAGETDTCIIKLQELDMIVK
jgi:hypothetical protein